jgi:transposase
VPKGVPNRAKFIPERRQKIVELLSGGSTLRDASKAVGIHEVTLWRWLERGKRQESGQYREFLLAVKASEAGFEAAHLANIERAGDGHDVVKEVVKRNPVTDLSGRPVHGEDGRPLFTETRETTRTREFAWQASAWLLERKWPERYGRRDQVKAEVTHKGEIGEAIRSIFGVISNGDGTTDNQ